MKRVEIPGTRSQSGSLFSDRGSPDRYIPVTSYESPQPGTEGNGGVGAPASTGLRYGFWLVAYLLTLAMIVAFALLRRVGYTDEAGAAPEYSSGAA